MEGPVKEITVSDGPIELPEDLRETKYPWKSLSEADPRMRHFFVETVTREEAKDLRSAIYSSGRNFYLSRHLPLVPVVRVMQKTHPDGEKVWGVVALVDLEEQGEGDEEK